MNALGIQVLAELKGISADHLNDTGLLERTLVTVAQEAGATVVESTFNAFAPHGVTGIVVVQESHLAIHTWPEHGYAALDIFTCSDRIDPEQIARSFSDAIAADSCDTNRIERGSGFRPSSTPQSGQGTSKRSIWFTDRHDNIALSLRHAGLLYSEQSAYQKVEVLESDGYGKILLLDERVAFTDRDEFVYHELIAHIPTLNHPGPQSVLVIGGGDGGAAREFLKHDSIDSVTVVELDPTVSEASQIHFPAMAASLDDDRANLVHGDGNVFLDSTEQKFDIIAVDCLDTAGDDPFDSSFYGRIKSALAPGGVCVSQVCPPTLSQGGFCSACQIHREHFTSVRPYLGFLPTYSTGMLSFLLSGESLPSTPRSTGFSARYVTEAVLESAFALPAFIQALIEE